MLFILAKSINGEIVVDGSVAGMRLVKELIRITIKDGKTMKIEGSEEAEKLKNCSRDLTLLILIK